jgi:hypothetical protein
MSHHWLFSCREIFSHTMMPFRVDRIPGHGATVYTMFFQFYTVWDARASLGVALQKYTRKKRKKRKWRTQEIGKVKNNVSL